MDAWQPGSGAISAAYARLGGRVFFKRADGRLGLLSYALFWPYFLLNALSLRAYRRLRGNTHWHEVAPRLFLGGYPNARDAAQLRNAGVLAVLDATSEWNAVRSVRGLTYKNIPVLDNAAPNAEQLNEGATWIAQQLARGPVYVHCALGHGRSALFVAAFLLLSKQAATPHEAVARLQRVRSGVRLNPVQMRALENFAGN